MIIYDDTLSNFKEDVSLNEKISEFQQMCEGWKGRYSQKLSVFKGYALYSENESLDIYELVREADKQMYLNKAEYYRTSGNDRRKIR